MDTRKGSSIPSKDLPIKKRPRPSPTASPVPQVKKLRKEFTQLFKSSNPPKIATSQLGQQPAFEHDKLLKNALEKLLSAILTSLKPIHVAEILRDIANFHRGQLTHLPADKKCKIAFEALCLYEKALTIEARNSFIEFEVAELVKLVPTVNQYKIDTKDTLERKARFAQECKDMGFVAFFWKSINRFLQQINAFNGNFANNVILFLLQHLDESTIIDAIIKKHVPVHQIHTVKSLFIEAFHTLAGHHTQVSSRV